MDYPPLGYLKNSIAARCVVRVQFCRRCKLPPNSPAESLAAGASFGPPPARIRSVMPPAKTNTDLATSSFFLSLSLSVYLSLFYAYSLSCTCSPKPIFFLPRAHTHTHCQTHAHTYTHPPTTTNTPFLTSLSLSRFPETVVPLPHIAQRTRSLLPFKRRDPNQIRTPIQTRRPKDPCSQWSWGKGNRASAAETVVGTCGDEPKQVAGGWPMLSTRCSFPPLLTFWRQQLSTQPHQPISPCDAELTWNK